MSWGNKLVGVFIVFIALIGTLVYKSINSSFDLVSKDYYKDELRYQETIDAQKSAAQFSAIEVAQNNEAVTIQFPEEIKDKKVDGEIWFYSNADASKDIKFKIEVDNNGLMQIAKSQLIKTKYTVKINWQIATTNYYSEKSILVQ
ncbi:MAG TPA: FixH family protein [Chitinophagaceae bacterium]|jgi:hypothetical protein|nr:FixH family protein [Chitinophagaceae bacterium]MBP9739774.1 FixH family protein [Chitinophagaceae bacterium]HPH25162.1 FixH family protein [Chitinophagaceae bacterium]